MIKIKNTRVIICICENCDKDWEAKSRKQNKLPVKCPYCQSLNWNKSGEVDN